MHLSLERSALASYVTRQLSVFFPDREVSATEIAVPLDRALERVEHNFRHSKSRLYFDGVQAKLDHLHTDQYCVFLYYLANTIHALDLDRSIAKRLYALNKALHGIDLFYEVAMPEIFGVQHPVGTVVGRGSFKNYLFLYQRCTIGGNIELSYPRLEEGVVLFGDTALIGDCHVGPNTWLSVGAKVVNAHLPGDQIVFGASPQLIHKPTKRSVRAHFFRDDANGENQ